MQQIGGENAEIVIRSIWREYHIGIARHSRNLKVSGANPINALGQFLVPNLDARLQVTLRVNLEHAQWLSKEKLTTKKRFCEKIS